MANDMAFCCICGTELVPPLNGCGTDATHCPKCFPLWATAERQDELCHAVGDDLRPDCDKVERIAELEAELTRTQAALECAKGQRDEYCSVWRLKEYRQLVDDDAEIQAILDGKNGEEE